MLISWGGGWGEFLRCVAPFIPVEFGHCIGFVLASPCIPRVPVFFVVLVFHVPLYSSVVSEALVSWR